ncbi:MAG: iron-containing alcohol dehydrogenase, partial [Actinobacteria bacterium]|nr:iron-containing alcohol dehydrogenase [Actinomycetota bacterium]
MGSSNKTSSLRGSGVVEDAISHLESAGVATTLYDKVESNSKDFNCMDAYQAYTEAECVGFVSVGD